MNLDALKKLLQQHQIQPSKKLDQHFIISDAVLQREVEAAQITETDTILEIGAGPGILTEHLLKTGVPVSVIEKDFQFTSILTDLGATVTLGDALKVLWPSASVIMSNVPYGISSPLLFKILETDSRVAILCLQKEFVDRMVAPPGVQDYSRLSVNCAVRSTVEKLEDVPRSLFYPQPKVDSAVVRVTPKKRELPENFDEVCRKLFTRKNKKARNNLEGYDGKFAQERVVQLTPADVIQIAEELNSAA